MPEIHGTIERRILINYRVDPRRLAAILPAPFEPVVIDGWGLAGICLIRLGHVRPARFPALLGLSSENAAHRIAVTWTADGVPAQGVYIPRRDTSSRVNAFLGGRLFPGVHHRARFAVHEAGGYYSISIASRDGPLKIAVRARQTTRLACDSVLGNLRQATEFFRRGAVGYSPAARPHTFDGLELSCADWPLEPLAVEGVESSFFDDRTRFPPGTIEFDSAFVMRGAEHSWRARGAVRSPTVGLPASVALGAG